MKPPSYFEVPTETVPLLSKGLIYPPEFPLFHAGSVDIRAMTVRDEEILLNRAYYKKNIALEKLIHACIVCPEKEKINIEDLLIGDMAAILISIRILGYGAKFSSKITCPNCENEQEAHFDLASLPIKKLEVNTLNQITKGQNLFSFVLPHSKKTVEYKFLTVREQKTITELEKKGNLVVTNPIATKLWLSIVAVEGIRDQFQIKKFVESLNIKDSTALRFHIEENEPYVDAKLTFSCGVCAYEEIFKLPLNEGLFGIDPSKREDLFLEPYFLFGYYFGMSYQDYLDFPVEYKKWLADRIKKEIESAMKAKSDIPTKAPHQNLPDVRSLTGKTKQTTGPARTQRFT